MNQFSQSLCRTLADGRFLVAFVAALLLALAVYYFFLLPVGALKHIDEYWTLDRVGSLAMRGDWLTVYSENVANLNKPPLQYWLSALLFADGTDTEFALRLPSYMFAILLLTLTGILALQLCPRLLAFPVAMLVLACSDRFWESGLSALLDAGAAFFATAALVAFFAAMRQPKWWYAVALLTGLGALQKAPLALGFVFVAALAFAGWNMRFGDRDARRVYLNRHFGLALIILLALLLSWPTIQVWKHGMAFLQQAYVDQIWERFAGDEVGSGLAFSCAGLKSLFRGQPLLEAPLFVAILALPFFIRRAEALACVSLFVLYLILSSLAGERGSPRYAMLVYPLMAASSAALTAKFLSARVALPGLVAYSLILGSPFKSAEAARLTESTQTRYIDFLRRIGTAVQPDETVLRCRWNRGRNPIFPGAISYYASGGKPVLKLTRPGALAGVAPPFRGVCTLSEYADLENALEGASKIEIHDGYVHWTAEGVIPTAR